MAAATPSEQSLKPLSERELRLLERRNELIELIDELRRRNELTELIDELRRELTLAEVQLGL